MNDEVSLPELVSGYADYYGGDVPEAAHALHESIDELYKIYKPQGKTALPSHVFWVGRPDSSKQSIRKYKIFFEGVLNYFDGLHDSVSRDGVDLIPTYCESDRDARDVPVGLVYLSKKNLAEWFEQAGIEGPQYLLVDKPSVTAEVNNEGQVLQAKELGSISLVISGLVNLIKEVDKAHAGQSIGDEAKKRADTIKRIAARLHSSRTIYNQCLTILDLADAAETDMPKSHKTLKKYMTGGFYDGTENSQ